jgi:hypothetical protein
VIKKRTKRKMWNKKGQLNIYQIQGTRNEGTRKENKGRKCKSTDLIQNSFGKRF